MFSVRLHIVGIEDRSQNTYVNNGSKRGRELSFRHCWQILNMFFLSVFFQQIDVY